MKFPLASRAQLYRELANYTRSAFGIEKACESILDRSNNRRLPAAHRAFCESILDGVRNGNRSIAASLDSCPAPISDLEKSIIDAGERGGLLERSFAHLAEHFDRVAEARGRIVKSLIYPVILFHVGALFAIAGSAVVSTFHPDGNAEGAWAIARRGLLWFGASYVLLIALGFGLVSLYRNARHSAFADAVLQRIPLLGSTHRYLALGRFCEVFSIHLSAGTKMDNSYLASGKAAHAGLILSASQRGAPRLAAGESLAATLSEERRTFPDPFVHGLASAEESGRLDEEFAHWAKAYSGKSAQALETLSKWAPKVFYGLVLITVALLILKVGFGYIGALKGWMDQMP